MRNMSFALTTAQVRAQSKTVTRRLGWATLKPGTLIQPVVKGMGLKPGEKVEKIGGPIRVLSATRERLGDITLRDCRLEGFPTMTTFEFITMFCQRNRGCTGETEVTRIEFEYVEMKNESETVDINTIGDDFPRQQRRVRELREEYRKLDGRPGVNVTFAIATIDQALTRAEQAMASGDIVAIVHSYYELRGLKE